MYCMQNIKFRKNEEDSLFDYFILWIYFTELENMLVLHTKSKMYKIY